MGFFICMLPNKMLSEITPAQLKFQQNLISVKNLSWNHQSQTFFMPHIASQSTHRCSKCFCTLSLLQFFWWNIQLENCWLKFILKCRAASVWACFQANLKVHIDCFWRRNKLARFSKGSSQSKQTWQMIFERLTLYSSCDIALNVLSLYAWFCLHF